MGRPKTTKVSRVDYCQYLFSSQINYTLTNFSEHVADLSHDMINRYLRDEHLTPSLVGNIRNRLYVKVKMDILFLMTVS